VSSAAQDEGVYGTPPAELVDVGPAAVRFSPFEPDARSMASEADASLGRFAVLAPPGVLERRYVLAQAVRIVRPGGEIVALARKDRGGLRLAGELAGFGCQVRERPRRHFRICVCERPANPRGLQRAIEAGGPQIPPALGLWSQPGVFSWDRVDPGSALLLDHLPAQAGQGGDLGCGIGLLAGAILSSPAVSKLILADIDRRAVDAARRNIPDPRAEFVHGDLRNLATKLSSLDFVVMNPPFHEQAAMDRALGDAFVRRAAAALRKGGMCRLVANIALPYEAILSEVFATSVTILRQGGYKILEATK
jgi:16S rRNA (guanine1207-N2)-methyltransferase